MKKKKTITKSKLLRVFQSVAGGQVAAETVAQEDHFVDSHLAPPLLDGHDELLLRSVRVRRELGPAALPEPQQVERVHLPLARQRLVVENLNVGVVCVGESNKKIINVATVLVFFD